MMKTKILLALCCLVGAASGVQAQDEHLRLQFDFSDVQGKSVADAASGVTAKLMSSASVTPMGKYRVLDLGNGSGYLDLTRNTGSIVRTLADFTVSVYYRVSPEASLSGNGYFLWAFSTSPSCTADGGIYSAYRLNAQRMATSPGGYAAEAGMEVGSEASKGRWTHVLYRQSGQKGELFIDGRRVQQNSAMPVLSSTFRSIPAYCWIGRAPFSADAYLRQTLVADFRLYDAALSDEQVGRLASVAQDLEHEFRYGTPGDFTSLEAALGRARDFMASAGDYAPNAVAELADVVALGERELSGGRASQALIDQYVSRLQTLLAAAKATAGFAPKQVFTPRADYGFVHPGGVVSQDDIDRARQLLASGDDRIRRAWDILCANGYSDAAVATWPVETIIRGGGSGQNYMNAARGAAMAFQNALRWKIGGTRANADAAVRILMAWARGNKWVGGDTNLSLAAGIYGHQFANAAELMRDYDGWAPEDFEEFRRYMVRTWYNPAIDFLRRRHDTWLNWRYANLGQRPGHYWSNWGLCNALCVMSIGILCDDVHMYNQGVSFYKYDHVGTFRDRSAASVVLNDGCNEFLGNLVPVVLPDARGPLGYLGQMQESGRDQGHALMALGLALDICQVGLTQGDDLYAYMDDRIAAGTEFVAAMNFGGVAASSLPWKNYNYADCRGTMGAGWLMTGPNEGGGGEFRPYWDRAIGYYEGLRGVKMQYAGRASAAVCPDGGGGNYSQNSGGFDHLGFSTLTSWRPAVDAADAITPLSGDIIYKGETLKNQTNLGGLRYNYEAGPSKGIPADGADITLVPQLPDGAEDTGNWQWSTGERTRQLTVKADRSYVYRVTYTAPNGRQSRQAFAIAVAGDAPADEMTNEITVDGTVYSDTTLTVLAGSDVTLYAGAATGWTDDYLWDNGARSSVVVVPALGSSRTYTCQYANQSGAVSQSTFHLTVVPARQQVTVDGATLDTDSAAVFAGADVVLTMVLPVSADPDGVVWHDGSRGTTFHLPGLQQETTCTATFEGTAYTFRITMKDAAFSYYQLLSPERGYVLVQSEQQLAALADDAYFVLASDDDDLLVGLADAPMNGNKALFYQTPADPAEDFIKLWRLEPFDGGYCLRNMDYDGLLIQTEWDAPWNCRTHDQPHPISWARFLLHRTGSAWTVENGTYPGNWLGLWDPAAGYRDGQEMACNKTGAEVGRFQLFALDKARFHAQRLAAATAEYPVDATYAVVNARFDCGGTAGYATTGTWGSQGGTSLETWHSAGGFDISQTITHLPAGEYTVSLQAANGDGPDTAYLYATAGGRTVRDVVRQSCVGSNFFSESRRMEEDPAYARLSVDITVTDGTLKIGLREPTSGTTWVVFDNFRLQCNGLATAIRDMTFGRPAAPGSTAGSHDTSTRTCPVHDLAGRRLNPSAIQRPGIYLVGPRKVVLR